MKTQEPDYQTVENLKFVHLAMCLIILWILKEITIISMSLIRPVKWSMIPIIDLNFFKSFLQLQ